MEVPVGLEKVTMDYEMFLNKPFFIGSYTWSTAHAQGASIFSLDLPDAIIAANEFLATPFRRSRYFRAKMCAVVQVAGTLNHAGMLCVDAVPFGTLSVNSTTVNLNRAMCAPHVFVFANQSTPGCLGIPFYVHTPVAKTSTATDDTTIVNNQNSTATIRASVFAPLTVGVGTNAVAVSVHIMFKELEFYVPKGNPTYITPSFVDLDTQGLADVTTKAIDGIFRVSKTYSADLLDNARSTIRKWTGLHNPNHDVVAGRNYVQLRNDANPVEGGVSDTLLDPYPLFRPIYLQDHFRTSVDEMEMSHLLQKQQYAFSFVATTADNVGTLVFARPIHPNMAPTGNMLQSKFYNATNYWSGDMELEIIPVMNNFQYCKLLIVKDYSKDYRQLTQYPTMADLTGLITDTIEFSGGGQSAKVDLPFLSEFKMLPNTQDYKTMANSHGMVYGFILQPLVVSNSAPSTVQFRVMLRGKDLQFYGHSSSNFYRPDGLSLLEDGDKGQDLNYEQLVDLNTQSAIIDNVELIDTTPNASIEIPEDDQRPVKHVRDFLRRMMLAQTRIIQSTSPTYAADAQAIVFPIADLLGAVNGFPTATNIYNGNANKMIRNMFFGYRGGVRVKFKIVGARNAYVQYVPPNMTLGNSTARTLWQTYPLTGAAIDSEIIANFGALTNSSFGLPMQEAANYHHGPFTWSGTELENTTIIDVNVPYRSALCYTGSAIMNRSNAFPPAYADTLGHLVLSCPTYFDQIAAKFGNIFIQVYVGSDDAARVGYQVFGETFMPTTSTDGSVKLTPYNSANVTAGAPSTTVPPVPFYSKLV